MEISTVWLKQAWIDILGTDRAFEMYGSGENTGQTVISGAEWLAHRGSVGRAFETSQRIRDVSDGRLLGPGEVGAVFMYPDDPGGRSEYRGADVPDCYQSVGDIGWLDSEGYLYLAGGRDDVINTGGVKVHPEQVEAALLTHPAIADALVFGTTDRDWGETVTAMIIPADPAVLTVPAGLDAFLAGKLDSCEIPKPIRAVGYLPRDGFGKISSKALRQAREDGTPGLT